MHIILRKLCYRIMSKRKDVATINLSFAGCGFLCIYHAGVVAAIKAYAPQLTSNHISGASAGAIAAAGLLCNVCISKSMDIILKVVRQARASSMRALSPMFNLIGMVRAGLEQILPPNAHLICTGRLFISLTRARDYKNVVVSEFRTRDELIQAIVCSSFIPFYCGRNPPKYRGVAYIDGGMSDNQPYLDKYTISVSPFSGESDICPVDVESGSFMSLNFFGTSIRCTSANLFRMMVCLFPPSQDICADICRRGFSDAMLFLRRRGLAPCDRCLLLETRVFGSAKAATPCTEMAASLRRNRTMPNFAKPARIEECDRCLEKFEVTRYPDDILDLPLPELVQKTLDDALAAESTWYRYLRNYRIFRWTMRFMTPVVLPMELMLYSARRIREMITTYTSRDFYLQQFQQMADFVLEEVDKRCVLFDTSFDSANIMEPYWSNEMRDALSGRDRTASLDERITLSSTDEYHSVASEPSYVSCKSDILPSISNDGIWIQDLRLPTTSLQSSSADRPQDSLVLENYNIDVNNIGETSSEDSAAGEDSGLSLTEDSMPNRNPGITRKRDSGFILRRANNAFSTPGNFSLVMARENDIKLEEAASSSDEEKIKRAEGTYSHVSLRRPTNGSSVKRSEKGNEMMHIAKRRISQN